MRLNHQTGSLGNDGQLGYDVIGVNQAVVADFKDDKVFGGVRIGGSDPMNQVPPRAALSA